MIHWLACAGRWIEHGAIATVHPRAFRTAACLVAEPVVPVTFPIAAVWIVCCLGNLWKYRTGKRQNSIAHSKF